MVRPDVGAAGFEPTTSCSQSRRATGLRYAPKYRLLYSAVQPIVKKNGQGAINSLPIFCCYQLSANRD